MSGFVLHPDALTDLTEIWEYIATDNPDAADRVLEEIRDAMSAKRRISHPLHKTKSQRVGHPESSQQVKDAQSPWYKLCSYLKICGRTT